MPKAMIIQKQYSFRGLRRIKIPLKPEELNAARIFEYLPKVLPLHESNAAKIRTCYDRYLAGHDIVNKQRLYAEQADNNNIVIEPHLFSIVEFKKGYIFGQAKEYAQTEPHNTDDIGYLNRYNREQNLPAKDAEEAQYIYACGVGYKFIRPNKRDFDIKKEAPFEIVVPHPADCFKVYSSYIGEEELFDVVLVNIDEPNPITGENVTQKTRVCVYTRLEYYEYEYSGAAYAAIAPDPLMRSKRSFHELPLVEKSAHPNRVGIVELGDSLQQAIDTLSSGSIDAFIDNANELLAIINSAIPGETADEKGANYLKMRKNGVLELTSTDPNRPADLKTVSNKINHADTQTKYDSMVRALYNITGTPMASGTNSSGGDTGQARALGNGWENAYTVASKDVQQLVRGDTELLRKALKICKMHSDCPINELSIGEIEIKYSLNRSDNLQVKTQSLQTLMAPPVNMPAKIALQICGLVSDPNAVADAMEKYAQELLEKAALNTVGDDLKAQTKIAERTAEKTQGQGGHTATTEKS